MRRRGLGWRRDGFDPLDGDHAFGAVVRQRLATPPAAATLMPFVAAVLDQGGLGGCVANAGMQAIRIAHVQQLLDRLPLDDAKAASVLGSRLWGYWFARAVEHLTGEDSGCQVRNLFAALTKLGVPPEAAWPYYDAVGKDAPFKKFPNKGAFRRAFDLRSMSYHRIDAVGSQRVVDVQTAIAAGYAVVAGWDVSEAFCDGSFGPDDVVPAAGTSDPIAGGHSMVVVEYDADCVTICNSWGSEFGAQGFFRGSYEWIETGDDFWIVETGPLFPEEA